MTYGRSENERKRNGNKRMKKKGKEIRRERARNKTIIINETTNFSFQLSNAITSGKQSAKIYQYSRRRRQKNVSFDG